MPDTAVMTTTLTQSSQSGEIDFTVTNNAPGPQTFCIFQTPLEDFRANILTVTNAVGESMNYAGVKIKRNPPKEKHFVTLDAGESRTASFRVDAGYRLVGPGPFSVRFNGNAEMNGLPDSNVIAFKSNEPA